MAAASRNGSDRDVREPRPNDPPGAGLPPDVVAFVREHVRSLMRIELLTHFVSHPSERWTAADVARSFYADHGWAATELEDLRRAGFVASDDGVTYRWAPARPELEHGAQALKGVYPERRHLLVETIYRSERADVREFADAFRVRKE